MIADDDGGGGGDAGESSSPGAMAREIARLQGIVRRLKEKSRSYTAASYGYCSTRGAPTCPCLPRQFRRRYKGRPGDWTLLRVRVPLGSGAFACSVTAPTGTAAELAEPLRYGTLLFSLRCVLVGIRPGECRQEKKEGHDDNDND